jgi:hypothetical protein
LGEGVSLWVILILVALLFVVMWGFLVVVIAFGTWFIARAKLPDDNAPRRGNDWDVPMPRDLRPPDKK